MNSPHSFPLGMRTVTVPSDPGRPEHDLDNVDLAWTSAQGEVLVVLVSSLEVVPAKADQQD